MDNKYAGDVCHPFSRKYVYSESKLVSFSLYRRVANGMAKSGASSKRHVTFLGSYSLSVYLTCRKVLKLQSKTSYVHRSQAPFPRMRSNYHTTAYFLIASCPVFLSKQCAVGLFTVQHNCGLMSIKSGTVERSCASNSSVHSHQSNLPRISWSTPRLRLRWAYKPVCKSVE